MVVPPAVLVKDVDGGGFPIGAGVIVVGEGATEAATTGAHAAG